jgi:hypothetical protein
VVFDGQVRYRVESSNFAFDSDVDAYNTAYLRTRLGATVQPQDGLKIYIQAQDSRIAGGHGTSGNTAEDSKLGLHQGYFAWNCQALDGLTILAGRFEMAKADERFFGAVGWDNVGRSYEGWALNYSGLPFAAIDLYGLKVVEAGTANMDQTAWGLYFNKIMGYNLDFFYNVHDFGENAAEEANALNTIGLHYDNVYFDALGVNFNFGMQMGTNEWGGTDRDYGGMMYGLDLSWTLGLGILEKVGFGYESMSGDGDATDDAMDDWMELYPTGHKFHGYMDIAGPTYSGSSAGLNDIQLNFWGNLPLGLQYKLDYHMFSYVEDTGLENNTDLGSEIDLTLKKSMGNFGVNLGYSMFTPTDNLVNDGDSMSWMYLQFIANF